MQAPPFSAEDFFGVFAAYNTAVWPVQVGLNILAVAAVALALRRDETAHRAIAFVLAFLWMWMAVMYHWIFFAEINPVAQVFAAAFAGQAAAFGWLALRTEPPRFRPRLDRFGIAGGALILYGLAIYPVVGLALGHAYPRQPTFGLPCPTTIFTLGILLWASPRVPWGVLAVPLAWSLLGASAVRYFGVIEDALLPVAGIVAGALILSKNRGIGDAGRDHEGRHTRTQRSIPGDGSRELRG